MQPSGLVSTPLPLTTVRTLFSGHAYTHAPEPIQRRGSITGWILAGTMSPITRSDSSSRRPVSVRPLLPLSPIEVQGERDGDQEAKCNPGGHSLALLCEFWAFWYAAIVTCTAVGDPSSCRRIVGRQTQDRARGRGARVAVLFVVLVLLALAYVLWDLGDDFYLSDLESRVEHSAYETLRPGGLLGHGYGIIGTLLILANLLYLARRRLARWSLGSMATWLNLHVLTGLIGSLLILFHSAFQFRTPIAVVTAVSPRRRRGDGDRGAGTCMP